MTKSDIQRLPRCFIEAIALHAWNYRMTRRTPEATASFRALCDAVFTASQYLKLMEEEPEAPAEQIESELIAVAENWTKPTLRDAA